MQRSNEQNIAGNKRALWPKAEHDAADGSNMAARITINRGRLKPLW